MTALLAAVLANGPLVQAPEDDLPQTIDELARSLLDDSRGERLYAARALRRDLRVTIRTLERGRTDSLIYMEAVQQYERLDDAILPACMQALGAPDVSRHCAQMLGMLQDPAARPALEAALETDPSGRTARAIEAALSEIPTE